MLALLALLAGCAPQRILTVESYPPGAFVRLDEKIIGRTPLEFRFDHYGQRRVTLYLPGYRTWSRRLDLDPPWHARFPIDVISELLVPIGLRDQHEVWVVLENDEVVGGHPDLGPLLERARQMRARGTELTPTEEQTADPDAASASPTSPTPSGDAVTDPPADAEATAAEPEATSGDGQ